MKKKFIIGLQKTYQLIGISNFVLKESINIILKSFLGGLFYYLVY